MVVTSKGSAIRVMIVDDSAFMRRAVERILLSSGDIEICGSVSSGELALEQLETLRPDLITMDIEMPGMGGLEAVKAIMKRRRTPIIMLSSLTSSGTESTIRALENGAADVVAKPGGGGLEISKITMELLEKVHALARPSALNEATARPGTLRQVLHPTEPRAPASEVNQPVNDTYGARAASTNSRLTLTKSRTVECVAIGISTGGPAALAVVCKSISAGVRVPIIIVQHMPAGFTKPLADRLNAHCALEVVEAEENMPMKPGRIILGMAGKQLRVKRVGSSVQAQVSETHGESLYMPSADVLFRSISEVYGRGVVAIIMTGMGNDGTEGLKELKKNGGYVYGQDEASCVVYGMPRAAAQAGVVDTVLPLESIADAINAASKGTVA